MRAFDADKLLDILDVMIVGHKSASDVYDVVDRMPTVDAVPVVRCKDCLYREGSIWYSCDYSAVYVRPNGYCQWGRKKEDETD